MRNDNLRARTPDPQYRYRLYFYRLVIYCYAKHRITCHGNLAILNIVLLLFSVVEKQEGKTTVVRESTHMQ